MSENAESDLLDMFDSNDFTKASNYDIYLFIWVVVVDLRPYKVAEGSGLREFLGNIGIKLLYGNNIAQKIHETRKLAKQKVVDSFSVVKNI